MPLRSFVDSRGALWHVWATHAGIIAAPVRSELREGWLTFDSGAERRRLSPIPDDWSKASPRLLERYCDSADRVSVHLGRLPMADAD